MAIKRVFPTMRFEKDDDCWLCFRRLEDNQRDYVGAIERPHGEWVFDQNTIDPNNVAELTDILAFMRQLPKGGR